MFNMEKKSYLILLSIVILLSSNQQDEKDNTEVSLSLVFNTSVYQKSRWGDPPQFAIWMMDKNDEKLITVAVTHRTAKNDWSGKASCPVSLPIWNFFTKNNTGENAKLGNVQVDAISGASFKLTEYIKAIFGAKKRNIDYYKNENKVDGISCATPVYNFRRKISIPGRSIWEYFIEVNCSGDYNNFYPSLNSQSGETDHYGNGQPSIVYRGEINTINRTVSIPVLYGKSNQHYKINKINQNLDSVTTAKNLISKMKVEILQ
jgi:hypothetical protein